MALAAVGQAQLIAHELDGLVRTYAPRSVAVIGCAGGNGFVLVNSEQNAKIAGTTWLMVGLMLYVARKTLTRPV